MSGAISGGKCILAGAGPGDPGLVTRRAKECIQNADVLLYDYLVNPEILRWARPDAEVIYVGKKAGAHTAHQGEINQLIVDRTRAGKLVVRLKGGDPIVFGRGAEEALELVRAGLRFEIVPGVASAIAGPAYAGIPVTHRGISSQLTIFTGFEDPAKPHTAIDYQVLAATPGTKVMLMGVTRLPQVTASLIEAGADPHLPVALVRWASTGRQKTLVGELGNIARLVQESGFEAPAIAIFGEVVRLRDQLNWFEKRPLLGRRIVVTRTRAQAGALSAGLRDLGADVYELPTIRIEPPLEREAFRELVANAHAYDWLIFTSPNGVDAFFDVFFTLHKDVREIGGARIAAIGPATAARIRSRHLAVDLQPKEAVAEQFVAALKAFGSVDNSRFLIVRAEVTREIIGPALEKLGAIVDDAIAYRTVPETEDVSGGIARFRTEGADVITFASSSAVENFMAMKLPMPEGLRIASIGPVTSATIREHGLKVDVEAQPHDVPSLIRAIRAAF